MKNLIIIFNKIFLSREEFTQKYCDHDYIFTERRNYIQYHTERDSPFYYYDDFVGDQHLCKKCSKIMYRNSTHHKHTYCKVVLNRYKSYTLKEETNILTKEVVKSFEEI